MAIDSSEIPYEQDVVEPKSPRGRPIGDKMIIGGAKAGAKAVELSGKAILGVAKLTKNVVSPPTRLVARNLWGAKWGMAVSAGAITLGGAAENPAGARDFTKALVTDPVATVRPAVPVVKDALLDAVDTAISKTRQGSELESGKNKVEMDANLSAVVGFYWPGASEQDRQKIETNVSVMHDYYVGTPNQKALLPPETYKILESKSKLIENSCVDAPWFANAVVGLAIAESRGGVDGKLENMTDAKALGPFMMTEDFIRDHGYEPTNDENDPRLSWEITVPIVVEELTKRTEHFGGNLGFAIMSWHRGVKAVDDDLLQLATQKGLSTDVPIAQLVHENSFTEFDLEEDPVIGEMLKQPGQDSTAIFVLRNAAGVLVWVHVHQLEEKIKSEELQKPSAEIIEFPQKDQEKAA